jgi:glycosyltransferase involved in cell wall biosynthesis
LTPTRHERLKELMQERGICESSYTLMAAPPAQVASYLSASDAGLAFIKPCFSKLASSPTKYAEYLGCGLPLIINSGIGDSDALITREGVGALVSEFKATDYAKASHTIERFVHDVAETRGRAREVAERLFDVRKVGVERYAELYEKVFSV